MGKHVFYICFTIHSILSLKQGEKTNLTVKSAKSILRCAVWRVSCEGETFNILF